MTARYVRRNHLPHLCTR